MMTQIYSYSFHKWCIAHPVDSKYQEETCLLQEIKVMPAHPMSRLQNQEKQISEKILLTSLSVCER